MLGKDTERKAGDSDKATSSIRFNSRDGSNLVDSRWCVTFRKRTAGGGKRKKKRGESVDDNRIVPRSNRSFSAKRLYTTVG